MSGSGRSGYSDLVTVEIWNFWSGPVWSGYIFGYLCRAPVQGHINLLRIQMGLSGLDSHRRKFHFSDNSICLTANLTLKMKFTSFLTCTGYITHRHMIIQLQPILFQYNHLLTNLAHKKHQKELCKILIIGTGIFEVDTEMFKIVENFITELKIQ